MKKIQLGRRGLLAILDHSNRNLLRINKPSCDLYAPTNFACLRDQLLLIKKILRAGLPFLAPNSFRERIVSIGDRSRRVLHIDDPAEPALSVVMQHKGPDPRGQTGRIARKRRASGPRAQPRVSLPRGITPGRVRAIATEPSLGIVVVPRTLLLTVQPEVFVRQHTLKVEA